mmetsp:Transcript_19779/g.56554  ORF Transcript_19779/g.56554 Transcript_19779/m.56554 type:complete len:202 (+) Transcript_19779:192-797(+)
MRSFPITGPWRTPSTLRCRLERPCSPAATGWSSMSWTSSRRAALTPRSSSAPTTSSSATKTAPTPATSTCCIEAPWSSAATLCVAVSTSPARAPPVSARAPTFTSILSTATPTRPLSLSFPARRRQARPLGPRSTRATRPFATRWRSGAPWNSSSCSHARCKTRAQAAPRIRARLSSASAAGISPLPRRLSAPRRRAPRRS